MPVEFLEYFLDLLSELLFLINVFDNHGCQVQVLEELWDLSLPLWVILDRLYVLVLLCSRITEAMVYRVKIKLINEPEEGQHVIL